MLKSLDWHAVLNTRIQDICNSLRKIRAEVKLLQKAGFPIDVS